MQKEAVSSQRQSYRGCQVHPEGCSLKVPGRTLERFVSKRIHQPYFTSGLISQSTVVERVINLSSESDMEKFALDLRAPAADESGDCP